MCSLHDAIVNALDGATYTSVAVSISTMSFFDEHSGGIVALCAVFTASSSMIMKWRKSGVKSAESED